MTILKKNTLSDFVVLFLDKLSTEKNLAISTINSYGSDLDHYIKFLSKNTITLEKSSYEDISKWLKNIKKQKFQDTTIIRKIMVIKQFYTFLFNEKLIMNNPSIYIAVPKKTTTLPKLLSEENVDSILNFLKENSNNFKNKQILVLTELLYATGLRVSELVTIKLSALDESLKNLLVRGKGGKERIIPIGEVAKKALNNYFTDHTFKKLKDKLVGDIWLFPSRKSHITRQTYFKKLKEVSIKVGIDPKLVSPHVFRHAFASHMLRNGADLKVIQYLLGHEDISTVEIYTHVNLKDSIKAIKKHPISYILPKE